MYEHIIQDIIINLIINKSMSFYANMLTQMEFVEDKLPEESLGAGVSLSQGYPIMYYDTNIWAKNKLGKPELTIVLEHEILHLLLNHDGRSGNRNLFVWNMAADMAINQMINVGNLPVLLPNEPPFNFPRDESAEQYYARLIKFIDKNDISLNGKPNGSGGNGKKEKDNKISRDGASVNISVGGKQYKKLSEGREGKLQKETKKLGKLAEAVIVETTRKAFEGVKQKGDIPGNLSKMIINVLTPPQVSWKTVLRNIVGRHIRIGRKASWKRLNKRIPQDGIKGYTKNHGILIAVVIDSSGSISDRNLIDFMTEIRAIQKAYFGTKVYLIECDCKIQSATWLKQWSSANFTVKGRGGTSFIPPFKHLKEKHIRPDILVYLTDLMGGFPEKVVAYPTVWVSVDKNQVAPFGKTLYINDRED